MLKRITSYYQVILTAKTKQAFKVKQLRKKFAELFFYSYQKVWKIYNVI